MSKSATELLEVASLALAKEVSPELRGAAQAAAYIAHAAQECGECVPAFVTRVFTDLLREPQKRPVPLNEAA